MDMFEQLSIFNKNLKFIMQKHGLTQKELSEKTGISTGTINNYVTKASEPSVNFLLSLKNMYGINLDDFFTKELSKEIQIKPKNELNMEKINRYLGSYIMYFYNSSEYKGKVSAYSKNTLKYGVISLVYEGKSNKIKAIANFIKSRDMAEELKAKLDEKETALEKEQLHASVDQLYYGNLEMSDLQLFIYLKSEELNDQSLIIFNNPPSNKKYIGGLGTANSISRGREHMPCIQYILLSRNILKIPDGEIYNLLALGISDVNVETETEQLIALFKNLYVNVDLKDDLNEFQKKKIVENSLTATLSELIDANTFRFAKVSNMEDDDYYRIISGEEL